MGSCPQCGFNFETPGLEQAKPRLSMCQACEERISSEAVFCPYCGHPTGKKLQVNIFDVDMDIGRMFAFTLKWFFAAIPISIFFLIFWVLAGTLLKIFI